VTTKDLRTLAEAARRCGGEFALVILGVHGLRGRVPLPVSPERTAGSLAVWARVIGDTPRGTAVVVRSADVLRALAGATRGAAS
jgi:hypothetical protein